MKKMVCLALAFLATRHSLADDGKPKITDRQISVAGFVDAGQVIQGTLIYGDGTTPVPLEDFFLNRDGIALTYSGTLNDKLHMNIGVGGLFWKPVAADPNSEGQAYKRILFGPGISEASAQFDFSPKLNLKFGFFGYKYNADAVNLGEYLLRSEAYPGIIQTGSSGSWVWLNSNEYKSMGVKLTWETQTGFGSLRQDFLLFSEFNQSPIFDLSPSYVANLKTGKAFEIGAGFSLHRWIPIKPSQTTPGGSSNTYVEVDNFPAFPAKYDPSNIPTQMAFSGGTLKGMENQIVSYTDSNGYIATQKTDSLGRTIFVLRDGTILRPRVETKLTFKAVKVMGMASLDLAKLLEMGEKNTGPFKIFAEVGVLGVENQPYFYEKIQNRIPIMVGVDIPTFGILDLVSLQLEYFKNPFPDNNNQQFTNSLPQPSFPNDNFAQYDYNLKSGLYDQDDLKWSVFVQKTLFPGLDLFVQVANDHFRVQDANAQPSNMPLTQKKSDWYYLLRFQWSM